MGIVLRTSLSKMVVVVGVTCYHTAIYKGHFLRFAVGDFFSEWNERMVGKIVAVKQLVETQCYLHVEIWRKG